MSDVEVIESVDSVAEAGKCFGEYDENFKECVKQCQLRESCKEKTRLSPKPVKPAAEEADKLDDGIEEFKEMDPFDFLVKTLQGKYDVSEKKDGEVTVVNCKKDGKPFAQVRRTETGRYFIRIPSYGDMVQLNAIGSVQKALLVYKAILA